MVVLTKSSKFGKYCVAGIDLKNRNWIRLVTNDEASCGAVAKENLVCIDGSIVQVLDVIDVPVLGPCHNAIQPENVLIDLNTNIEKVQKMSIEDVIRIHPLENRIYILENAHYYVEDVQIGSVGYSLTIVEVSNLEIIQEETPSGNPKTKVNFDYNGYKYEHMSVTDEQFYSVNNGTKFDKAILVVSIGTPYKNRYYKFVSAIYIYDDQV